MSEVPHETEQSKWIEKYLHIAKDGTFVLPESSIILGDATHPLDKERLAKQFGAPPEVIAKKLAGHLGKIAELSGNLTVSMQDDDENFRIKLEGGEDLKNDLTFDLIFKPGEKDLYIHLATVGVELQGTGVIKEAFRGLLDTVAGAGEDRVESISLLAALDVGGYAWAKYGFVVGGDPSNVEYTNESLCKSLKDSLDSGKIVAPEKDSELETQMAAIRSTMESRKADPTLISFLADLKIFVTVKDPFLVCPVHRTLPPKDAKPGSTCERQLVCKQPLDPMDEEWVCKTHGIQYDSVPVKSGSRLCAFKNVCGETLVETREADLGQLLLLKNSWKGTMPLGDSDELKRLKKYIQY